MEMANSPTSLYNEFLAMLKCDLTSRSPDSTPDSGDGADKDVYISRLDPLGQKYIKHLMSAEINSEIPQRYTCMTCYYTLTDHNSG